VKIRESYCNITAQHAAFLFWKHKINLFHTITTDVCSLTNHGPNYPDADVLLYVVNTVLPVSWHLSVTTYFFPVTIAARFAALQLDSHVLYHSPRPSICRTRTSESRGSSVNIVSDYRLDQGSIPDRDRGFFL
jgi:hypothetical protein